jgi:hypothetical protein
VTGGWRNLHNEELHNFVFFDKYNQHDQVNENEMGSVSSTHRKRRKAYRILIGKTEGKRPLGRFRRRWVDNIKMDLREIG